MEFFFADDSKQSGARDGMGKVIAIGGVFVDESSVRELSAVIDGICTDFGVPKGEEIKWSPKRNSWIYKNLVGDDRTECYSRILSSAVDHGVRALVVCWDTGRTRLKEADAFDKCIDFLFERVEMHLDSRNSNAIIVADRPGGGSRQEEKFLSDFVSRVEAGTDYVVPDHVLLNVLTTPSHLQRPLQLADLITGITTAMVCGLYRFAGPLFSVIREMLIKNTLGTIGGAGLKLFPDELVNLYCHVLQEVCFCKPSMRLGWPLPAQGRPYITDLCAAQREK